jgi:hypothetical protein
VCSFISISSCATHDDTPKYNIVARFISRLTIACRAQSHGIAIIGTMPVAVRRFAGCLVSLRCLLFVGVFVISFFILELTNAVVCFVRFFYLDFAKSTPGSPRIS